MFVHCSGMLSWDIKYRLVSLHLVRRLKENNSSQPPGASSIGSDYHRLQKRSEPAMDPEGYQQRYGTQQQPHQPQQQVVVPLHHRVHAVDSGTCSGPADLSPHTSVNSGSLRWLWRPSIRWAVWAAASKWSCPQSAAAGCAFPARASLRPSTNNTVPWIRGSPSSGTAVCSTTATAAAGRGGARQRCAAAAR